MPTTLRCIGHSGLFDTAFYLSRNPDLQHIGSGALLHYHCAGWREGRKPNAFFDPTWYLTAYRDVTEDPLHHYLTRGEYEGRRPVPWFDPVWYRQTNHVPANINALAHYLAHKHLPHIRPLPEFDPTFYLNSYPDVAASGMDPVEHYMVQGFKEVRRPFSGFDPAFYKMRYLRHRPDDNPFLHWLAHRHEPGVFPCLPEHETTIAREIRRRTQPGSFFEERCPLPDAAIRRARVLAYYLPQFHADPANESWWGTGFTEWTNLSRGVPRFADHYQPRIPRDLGHYRLDTIEPLRTQARMAKESGIEGFIFYYYWFDRTRLLDHPLEGLLRTPELDLPFCLMWANENWSRRWDGGENDVLITQNYHEDDDHALIADLARHMNDKRYIRIAGRPLFMIYRPGAIPDAPKRIAQWRILFRKTHALDPLIIMAQAFGDHDPRPFGLDGVIEFPPHKLTESCAPMEDKVQILDEDMTTRIYDYAELIDKARADPAPAYPRIRTIAPSWDNDARRQGAGLVLHGSTPRLYERWLNDTIVQSRDHLFFGEPFVCINAWNEWAEGAYLEPDVHFGSSYLNATARAVTGFQGSFSPHRLLLVGHDAFPAGAQMLLLAVAKALKRNHGIDVIFVLLEGGELITHYRQVGTVEIIKPGTKASLDRLISLHSEGVSAALVNSAVSAKLASDLERASIPYTLLIHELPGMIRHCQLDATLSRAREKAHKVIVPGALLTRFFPEALILPQGLYHPIAFSAANRRRVRLAYGIDSDALLVIGVGYGDSRKGFDLFLHLWSMVRSPAFLANIPRKRRRPVHFMWVGALSETLKKSLASDIETALATRQFHLPGHVEDVGPFLSAADVFLLTSREDPYPSAALEALAAGLPCVAFAENGVIPSLLDDLHREGDTRHKTVAPGDLPAMGQFILTRTQRALQTESERTETGNKLANRFSFDRYAAQLKTAIFPDLPTLSVVVLSYNYAQYLSARLATIFAQNCPITEIIVLDDASQDESPALAESTAQAFDRTIKLVHQPHNSGSVFEQWKQGITRATGEWIWIAEADDLSEPDFLSSLIGLVAQAPDLVMAFSDSRAIDHNGIELAANYQDYYRTHVGHRLARDMLMDGDNFVRTYLAKCNLIMNVSAALFRRQALKTAIEASADDLKHFELAGDWRIYIELLLKPKCQVAFLARSLNIHRRHDTSITATRDPTRHLAEIARMHELIVHRLGESKALLDAQRAYRETLAHQFGLSTTTEKRRARTV